MRFRPLAFLLLTCAGPTAAAAADEVFRIVSGGEVAVQGGEQVCFEIDPSTAREVELRVEIRFTSWVPRGWLEVDGVAGPDFGLPTETFAFRVDPSGVHRLSLLLEEDAAIDRFLVRTSGVTLQQASCRLYEDRRAQRVREAPEPVNRLRLPDPESDAAEPSDAAERSELPAPEPQDRSDESVILVIPAGTGLELLLEDGLSSRDSHPGQRFSARLDQALVLGGETVLPVETRVVGRVAGARDAGRFGRSTLDLAFERGILPDGREFALSASLQRVGPGSAKKQGRIIGGAALGGALLGRVLGGDSKDAVRGAVLGGAIAAGSIAAEPGEPVVLPPGALLSLTLDRALELPASR